MSSEQRKSFYDKIAKFQAELSSTTFPKIGSLARREDGAWEIRPLPGLGGPFDTTTEYLDAWADAAKFDDLECLEEMYGKERGNRIKASILAFPSGLKKLAATIPVRNHSPFPLIHSDFALWNVVVDDNYKVLGVIDWEYGQSGPWEMVHFPTCFVLALVPMGPSEWSDDAGIPDWLKVSFREMEEYVDVVRQAERAKNLSPTLSAVLSDPAGQDLAYAMRLYTVDGKHGYYARILEKHRERWGGGNKDSEAAQLLSE